MVMNAYFYPSTAPGYFMQKNFICLGLIVILFACKDKKTTIKAGEIATAADFVAFYPEATLPYIIADTMLARKPNAIVALDLNTLSKYIPDSVWKKDFGKNASPKFFALGRAKEKEKESY